MVEARRLLTTTTVLNVANRALKGVRTLHSFTNSKTDFGESDMVAFCAIKDFVDHFGGNLCSLDFAVEDSNPRSLLFEWEP